MTKYYQKDVPGIFYSESETDWCPNCSCSSNSNITILGTAILDGNAHREVVKCNNCSVIYYPIKPCIEMAMNKLLVSTEAKTVSFLPVTSSNINHVETNISTNINSLIVELKKLLVKVEDLADKTQEPKNDRLNLLKKDINEFSLK